jgi:hypothetical protein
VQVAIDDLIQRGMRIQEATRHYFQLLELKEKSVPVLLKLDLLLILVLQSQSKIMGGRNRKPDLPTRR